MRLIFRQHAMARMFERQIDVADARTVLETGTAIMSYQEDTPYPSKLTLGWIRREPLHVLSAESVETGETIVITAYRPDPDLWTADFTSKRK